MYAKVVLTDINTIGNTRQHDPALKYTYIFRTGKYVGRK
jgi:hypothetical protein